MGKPTIDQLNSINQIISNDISDELALINPNFSPLISYIFRKGLTSKIQSTTIEWIDNFDRKTSTTLKDALDTGETLMTVNDEEVLVKDGLYSIGDEVVKVSVVGSSGEATIVRAQCGTSKYGSSFGVGTPVKCLGIEMEEGGELKPSTTKVAVTSTNNTGILYESYEVTETMKNITPLGQGGLSVRELESQKKKDELMAIMENRLLNGVKFSSNKARQSAGLKSLIKKGGITFDASQGEISLDLINQMVRKIVDKGNPGAANLQAGKYSLCVGWDLLTKINALNKDNLRTGISEKTTGTTVTEIVTVAGPVKVFPAPSLLPHEALLINLDDIELGFLYPMKEEVGAKEKLSDFYFIHTEYCHKLKNLPFQLHATKIGRDA